MRLTAQPDAKMRIAAFGIAMFIRDFSDCCNFGRGNAPVPAELCACRSKILFGVYLFRQHIVELFARNLVLFARPTTKIDQPAALRAKRAIGVGRCPLGRFSASRAGQNAGGVGHGLSKPRQHACYSVKKNQQMTMTDFPRWRIGEITASCVTAARTGSMTAFASMTVVG